MYRLLMVGILGLSVMTLTVCESMTGKTAGRTIDDATITASVQGKLTNDKASNFTRINVDTERGVVTLTGVVLTAGGEIASGIPRAEGGGGIESEQQSANTINVIEQLTYG